MVAASTVANCEAHTRNHRNPIAALCESLGDGNWWDDLASRTKGEDVPTVEALAAVVGSLAE